MIKTEYCPYCQYVRQMVQTQFLGENSTSIEYHCATCKRYVRTEWLPKKSNDVELET